MSSGGQLGQCRRDRQGWATNGFYNRPQLPKPITQQKTYNSGHQTRKDSSYRRISEMLRHMLILLRGVPLYTVR
jgi:hypothetical protein